MHDITQEQLRLIKLHLIIPYAITVLEDDAALVGAIGSFGSIYAAPLKEWQNKLFHLKHEVSRMLREDGIKVNLLEQSKQVGVRAEYWHKRIRHTFGMTSAYVKAEVETLIREMGK